MRGNRFIVIIAHPTHGRIKRFQVPHGLLHVLGAAVLVTLIVAIGLSADYFRHEGEHQRLVAENTALQEEYDNLLVTVEERDKQLESLSNLAYQISIAYGFSREESDAEVAYGPELIPAYHASLNQYDLIQDALAGSAASSSAVSMMGNTTPSIWPVKGHITSGYGRRQDPFNGEGVFHPGIDFSAPYGSPVFATADGYVLSAEWEGGLGHCVKLVHGRNGFRTIYGHLKEYFVRPGQSVRRGEVIGLVGNSGRTTGKHLHYEVHYKGMNVNPYKYLRNKDRGYTVSLAD